MAQVSSWAAWRGRLRRRRGWLIALGILVVLRIALPYALRPILVSQASKALQTEVKIGDLSLSLLFGGVELGDVSVAPPPALAKTTGDTTPLVAWKRLAVELRYFPLTHRAIRLRRLEIDSPRVALTRLADGTLNLQRLVPPSAPEKEPKPAPGKPWGFGLDHFVLRDGDVRFVDLKMPPSEPIDLRLDQIEVNDLSFQPGLYGEPSRLNVHAEAAGGTLDLAATLAARPEGLAVDAGLRSANLDLSRARLYIPRVGWSELRGRLDTDLRYQLDGDRQSLLSGSLALRELAVRVAGYAEPALGWKRLAVTLSGVDLLKQRADVSDVSLAGLSVLVRPQGGDLLPLLKRPAEVKASPAAAPPAGKPVEAKAGAAKPWAWSVGKLAVGEGSQVRLLGREEPVQVGVDVQASDVQSGEGAAPLRVDLTVGDGTVAVDGQVDVAKPTFGGTIRLTNLPLHVVVGSAGVLAPGLLQGGILSGDLALGLGVPAPGAKGAAPEPGSLDLNGRLALADLWVAGDPKEFAIGSKSLVVPIEDVRVPRILPGGPPGPTPISVDLGALELVEPYVLLTRAKEGIVLPPFTAAEAARAASGAPPPPAPAPEAAPAAAAPAAAAPAGPPKLVLSAARARIQKGRVYVVDRTVKPFFRTAVTPLEVDARGIRWPELVVKQLRVDAVTSERGRVQVTGSIGPKGTLVVKGRDLALPAFNPYATAYSDYSIGSGKLDVDTKASFGGGEYDSVTALTLHNFDVQSASGGAAFLQNFGIPLEVGLALLRDVSGNISLDVPVAGGREGTKVGFGSIILGALRRALLNALASPLKLVGAVLPGKGGEGQPIGPQPIVFATGRADLASGADTQIEALATFLASRPGIGVQLDATPSESDARWLREQALRQQLESQGALQRLASLPERGTRNAILKALAARAKGEPGELTPEQETTLQSWLDERAPFSAEALQALGKERLARVEAVLTKEHGVEATRIGLAPVGEKPVADPPALRLTLGVAQQQAATP